MRLTVLLVLADTRARDTVVRALTRSGVAVSGAFGDGASLLRAARTIGPCLALCGTLLPDMTAANLRDALGGACSLYVLCRAGEEAQALANGLRPLLLPATSGELAASVRGLLLLEEERARDAVRRSPPVEALVQRAKDMIQRQTGCTEAQAHRVLQRLSMGRGLPLAQVAQQVIDGDGLP